MQIFKKSKQIAFLIAFYLCHLSKNLIFTVLNIASIFSIQTEGCFRPLHLTIGRTIASTHPVTQVLKQQMLPVMHRIAGDTYVFYLFIYLSIYLFIYLFIIIMYSKITSNVINEVQTQK